ncbi:MAG TPA: DUF2946 domain-containing protein, partial [Methylophilaceae bacterium]|nr:DUF2946 domain-containing protein [Methylophilaceae bacterium]
MKPSGRHSRLIAWVACIAILLNALAPAITHAMASARGDISLLQEVCSAAGNKSPIVLHLGIKKPSNDKDSKSAPMQHCPYCYTHAGSFGMVTGFPPLAASPDLAYSAPELFYHAPRPLFVWAAS